MRKDVSFQTWAAVWLKKKEPYIKDSTKALYRIAVNMHLLPFFGQYPLNKISCELIQKFISKLAEEGKAGRSIKTYVMILKISLNAAMRENIMPMMSLRSTFRIPERKKALTVLTIEEQKRLLQAVRSNLTARSLGIATCLLTGMRIGELCALQYKDIDISDRLIFVSKTVNRISLNKGTRLVMSSPKSKSSIREIPISSTLLDLLQTLPIKNPDIYVVGGTSTPMEPNTFRRFFYSFLKKAGIRKVKVHALRHTMATTSVGIGADPVALSKLLGHADVLTTQKLYIHPQIEQKRKCVENFADLLK
jgi:integrase